MLWEQGVFNVEAGIYLLLNVLRLDNRKKRTVLTESKGQSLLILIIESIFCGNISCHPYEFFECLPFYSVVLNNIIIADIFWICHTTRPCIFHIAAPFIFFGKITQARLYRIQMYISDKVFHISIIIYNLLLEPILKEMTYRLIFLIKYRRITGMDR